jgi:hypothetical protein
VKARAFIAIPLPPPATWTLLRDRDELPDGYAIVGSIEIGRAETPALPRVDTSANLRARLGLPAPAPQLCETCPLRARQERP